MTSVPRVVVSAPSSQHGKSAVTVGLVAGYAARGVVTAAFKVGPDQTDAGYLGLAAERVGRNLDPRLVGAHRVAPLFAHGAAGAGIAVVEGTMGLFDSFAGRPEIDSTAAVATALRAPVVLVVDVATMGQSVAALVHGFRAYDEMLWLGGVILNRVASDRHEQLLREALDDIGVPVFGVLRRRDLPAVLPSRQHGLVPVAQGDPEVARGARRLGEVIAETVDLDRLLALARSAPRLPVEPWSATDAATDAELAEPPTLAGLRRPVVALAGGVGGSYSYPETAELLTAAGAEVVAVDPLRDEALPPGTDALVVGGGLPESYGEELSANRRLCISVAELARTGRPVIAEGAGLLWLAREFDGRPMCGVLDAAAVGTDRIIVGYREATARASSVVAPLGARLVGYKQHSAVLRPRAGETPAWTWSGGAAEGFVVRRTYASQLILHWAGAPEIARRLVTAAAAAPDQAAPVPGRAPVAPGRAPAPVGPGQGPVAVAPDRGPVAVGPGQGPVAVAPDQEPAGEVFGAGVPAGGGDAATPGPVGAEGAGGPPAGRTAAVEA